MAGLVEARAPEVKAGACIAPRMRAWGAAAMLRFYPGLERFRAVRAAVAPADKSTSAQSRRLGL